MPKDDDDWRDGRDPVQRWLRIVTTLVVLGVFVFLAVSPTVTGGADRVVVIAMALGAVLMLLGYEGMIKLPVIGRERKDD